MKGRGRETERKKAMSERKGKRKKKIIRGREKRIGTQRK